MMASPTTDNAMITNIRVEVSKKYRPIYTALTQDASTRQKVFKQHGDLFVLCALVGYRAGQPSRVIKGQDLFFSHYLNVHQQTVLKAIAVEASQGDYAILSDPQKVIDLVEQYAEAGMGALVSSVLADYVVEHEGEYTVQFSDADMLEKSILNYVRTELSRPPL